MILIPILALAVGIILGSLVGAPVTGVAGVYLAVACLAGIDSICGGLRSYLENKYHADVFVTGFLSNIAIAFFLAWLGDRIGANLFLASVIVFGGRIFVNLSLIRRYALAKWTESRLKRKNQQEAEAQARAQTTTP